jgi:NAD-dependent DNA ligase
MIKNLIPSKCPNCNTSLLVKKGKGDDIFKLFCPNNDCGGGVIKKLIKGVKILEIKNIGPSTIEKLYNIGVENCIDIFDKSIINKKNMIESGEFKEGKALENILNSIKNYKELSVDKAIHSMQIEIDKLDEEGTIPIGSSLSNELGKMISGVDYDFSGLSLQIRKELENLSDSELYNKIMNNLKRFEVNGINIKYFEKIKKVKSKKSIHKNVSFETNEDIKPFLDLGWVEVGIKDADILIVDDKNKKSVKVNEAINNAIKILTYKQAKLLFL